MKRLNKLMAMSLLLFLFGCSTAPVKPSATLPSSMTSPCEPLEELQGMTGKDLTNNITHNAAIYWRCVDKYNALREAVSEKK
jgi:hypothetical protein